MSKSLTHLTIAIGVPALLCILGLVTVSAWVVEYPTSDTVAAVIPWSLGDAALWRRTARGNSLSLSDEDLRQSAIGYRRALALNPLDSLAWDGLVTIESRLGGDLSAEASLRGWTTAIPNSPRAAWALANLLLRQGKTDESLPYFRRVATHDLVLRRSVFPLARKVLDDPGRIIAEIIPEDDSARVAYFNHLLNEQAEPRHAEAVWEALRAGQSPRAAAVGLAYADYLASLGRGAEAQRVWRLAKPELAAAADAKGPAGKGERITNGDFEQPLLNSGLDWQASGNPGYQIAPDDFVQSSGGRSLRVQFDGTENPDLYEPRQWVVVEPNRAYLFRAAMKTNNLSSADGVYWMISNVALAGVQPLVWKSQPQLGTNPWTVQELDIRTGPEITVLQIQLRHEPGSKLGSPLSGTVWVDAVSLRPR